MKNNILIFTTIFFGIFTFAQEEPETIVPENPEQLVNDSIVFSLEQLKISSKLKKELTN